MKSEYELIGLYVPGLLVCAIIASVLWFVVDGLMMRVAGWRLFWHPPLARVALYMILLAATVALTPDL